MALVTAKFAHFADRPSRRLTACTKSPSAPIEKLLFSIFKWAWQFTHDLLPEEAGKVNPRLPPRHNRETSHDGITHQSGFKRVGGFNPEVSGLQHVLAEQNPRRLPARAQKASLTFATKALC